MPELFPEEERSKQPSAFSILRALIGEFQSEQDSRLALVGAFGYDLLFQFDPIELKLPRHGDKDLQLFLCDDIYYMDRKKEQIERFRYDFELGDLSTAGLARTGAPARRSPKRPDNDIESDHQPKSTWPRWKRCAKACARANTTKWSCGRPSRPTIPRARPRCSSGFRRAAPARTSSCCNWATSN